MLEELNALDILESPDADAIHLSDDEKSELENDLAEAVSNQANWEQRLQIATLAGPQFSRNSYEKSAKSYDLAAFLVETKRIELWPYGCEPYALPNDPQSGPFSSPTKSAIFMLGCESCSGMNAHSSQRLIAKQLVMFLPNTRKENEFEKSYDTFQRY